MSKIPNAKSQMWFDTGIMMKRLKITFKRLLNFILQISLAFTEFQLSGSFTVSFEHISHFFKVLLLWLWTSKCLLGRYYNNVLITLNTIYTLI